MFAVHLYFPSLIHKVRNVLLTRIHPRHVRELKHFFVHYNLWAMQYRVQVWVQLLFLRSGFWHHSCGIAPRLQWPIMKMTAYSQTKTVSEAYPSRLHKCTDYLKLEPASHFKNAINNELIIRILNSLVRSKNTANRFRFRKINSLLHSRNEY